MDDETREPGVGVGGTRQPVEATLGASGGNWSGPPGRRLQMMAYDGQRAVMFGGAYFNDTWTFSSGAWQQLSPSTSPPARGLAAMAYNGQYIVLFGGSIDGGTGDAVNDTWTFDGTNWTQLQPANSPSPRVGAKMAYDGRRIVLFGGREGQTNTGLADTWIFDGTNWTKLNPAVSPPARSEHAMAFDGQQIVVFGGNGPNSTSNWYPLGDTWTFDGITWTQQQPSSAPIARFGAAFGFHGESVVIFGGYGLEQGSLVQQNDTWVFQGGTWTQLQPQLRPSPRYGSAMAFDGQELVLFGGSANNANLADTWMLRGSNWTRWPSLVLSRVINQGSPAAVNLQLNWSNTPQPTDPSAYIFQVQAFTDSEGTDLAGLPVETQNANSGTWNPTAAQLTLQEDFQYWIAAIVSLSGQPQDALKSNLLPILRYPVTLVSVIFDGEHVDLTFVPDADDDLCNGTHVAITVPRSAPYSTSTLVDQDLTSTYAAIGPSDAISCRFDLSALPLSALGPVLTLGIYPIATSSTGRSTGPVVTATIYTVEPLILRTRYQGATLTSGLQYSVTVLNQGYGSQTPPQFLATVSWNGIPRYGSMLLTSTIDSSGNLEVELSLPASLPLFAGSSQIPPGLELDVSLAAADGVSVGPAGPPAKLLIATPELIAAAYTLSHAAGRLAVTIAYPPSGPPQPAAEVKVWRDTTPVWTTTVVGTTGSTAVTLDADAGYTATVAAMAGESIGPPSAPISLFSSAPTLTSVSYDGTTARASWEPLSDIAGMSGVVMSVASGGVTVASTIVNDTSAALDVPAGAAALALQVGIVGPQAQGPLSQSVTLITAAPAMTGAITDPVTGTTTLSWSAPEHITSFVLQVYANGAPSGQPVNVTAASYTFRDPLTPNASLAVAVAAASDVNGVAITGPYGAPYPLPTAQPKLLSVDYNGSQASVSWLPVEGANGYTASVLKAGASAPVAQVSVGATVTLATLTTTISDASQSYTAVVQATINGNSGRLSESLPLFTPGLFVSTAPAAQASPHIRLRTSPALAPIDGTIYLPDLGLGTTLDGLPLTQGPFTLAENTNSVTSGRFKYILSTTTSQPWTFGPAPIRTQLQTNWIDFLKAVEISGVTPWGIAVLQQVVSRSMPQTFQETLYYAYGLDLENGCTDLRPGMVLRVAFADYVKVGGSQTPPWIDGYAGGAVVDYDVASYLDSSGWSVGFDTFIAQLVGAGVLQVTAPPSAPSQQTEAGVADAADLFYPDFCRPFYRLFFPSQLTSPSGSGTVLAPSSFVLAAAPSFTALASTVNYPTSTNAIAYFRGRVVVKVCIRVTIDGVDEVVPIGTTVGNILERYAQRPPGAAVGLDGLLLERACGPVVTDPTARFQVGSAYRVRLDWGTAPIYGAAQDSLTLPLLHGDRLTIGA